MFMQEVWMEDDGRVSRRRTWRGAMQRVWLLSGILIISGMTGFGAPILGWGWVEDDGGNWRQFGTAPAGRIEEVGGGVMDAWQWDDWESDTPIEDMLAGLVVSGGYSIGWAPVATIASGSEANYESDWAAFVTASNAALGLGPDGLPLASRAVVEMAGAPLAYLRDGSGDCGPGWVASLWGRGLGIAEAMPPVVAVLAATRTYRLSGTPVAAFAMAEPATVPEPGSLILAAFGLAAAVFLRGQERR